MVGGGAHAAALATSLRADGHAVRAVPFGAAEAAALRDAGCDVVDGDPDRIGTIRDALDGVTILLWLLADDAPAELHGSRLRMMLERTTDTTVRGVVYEAGGPHDAAGLAEMRHARETNEIPWTSFGRDAPDWVAAARAAIGEVLGAAV